MAPSPDMYDLFNRKLVEFANDLVYIFPTVGDFQIFQTACDWSMRIDKKAPQSFFDTCVVQPFKAKILCKDESFFLDESYSQYSDYMQYYGSDMNLILKLKVIWKTLDLDNKEVIWKYMQVLTMISEKCTTIGLQNLDSKIFVPK